MSRQLTLLFRFNPCFLEVPLQLISPFQIWGLIDEFQSLFFWKSRFQLGVNVTSIPRTIWHVSILVFLEVPLQQAMVVIESLRVVCFNPCFSGSPASTAIKPISFQFQALRTFFDVINLEIS